MNENKLRIVLIPAYEPEERLIDLLESLCSLGMSVIVVDDGSGASFSHIFKRASQLATVLTYVKNCGKGCRIKTGLQYISEHFPSPYTVITMDADGQHQVFDVARVCERAEQSPCALILGSRRLKENAPLRSRFGNTITRLVYKSSTGIAVHDTQTGLRGFGSALLPMLTNISGERYEYEMNVLLEFARKKIPIEEIVISTIYFDNNSGSHFNTLRDSYRIYKEILKYSASSFISFLLDYTLYSVLIIMTTGLGNAGLTLSNVVARIVSASFNYTINRKLLFKSEKSAWKSAVQYFMLAATILICNTFVLSLLVRQLDMNQFAAKILTETLLFTLSWLVQRFFIFSKKERPGALKHIC